jgi:hypothetical protein
MKGEKARPPPPSSTPHHSSPPLHPAPTPPIQPPATPFTRYPSPPLCSLPPLHPSPPLHAAAAIAAAPWTGPSGRPCHPTPVGAGHRPIWPPRGRRRRRGCAARRLACAQAQACRAHTWAADAPRGRTAHLSRAGKVEGRRGPGNGARAGRARGWTSLLARGAAKRLLGGRQTAPAPHLLCPQTAPAPHLLCPQTAPAPHLLFCAKARCGEGRLSPCCCCCCYPPLLLPGALLPAARPLAGPASLTAGRVGGAGAVGGAGRGQFVAKAAEDDKEAKKRKEMVRARGCVCLCDGPRAWYL